MTGGIIFKPNLFGYINLLDDTADTRQIMKSDRSVIKPERTVYLSIMEIY